ncbi:hypothetical protein ACT2CR_00700 [Candidatus Vidania fulgoroideorum]
MKILETKNLDKNYQIIKLGFFEKKYIEIIANTLKYIILLNKNFLNIKKVFINNCKQNINILFILKKIILKLKYINNIYIKISKNNILSKQFQIRNICKIHNNILIFPNKLNIMLCINKKDKNFLTSNTTLVKNCFYKIKNKIINFYLKTNILKPVKIFHKSILKLKNNLKFKKKKYILKYKNI